LAGQEETCTVAALASMWAWVSAGGRTPTAMVQVKNAWAWVKRLLA
jgi:hypothetical protein